ncbi:MAG: hypothetical protein HY438_02425 [DPANN group archaeon]|nr:hypothetical protein [DPANN group archaeon]
MGMGRRVDVGQQADSEAPRMQEKSAVEDGLLAERYSLPEKEILDKKDSYLAANWHIIISKDGRHDVLTPTHKESELFDKNKNAGIFRVIAKAARSTARSIAGNAYDGNFSVIIMYSQGRHEFDVPVKKYYGSNSTPVSIHVKMQYELGLDAIQLLFSDINMQRVTEKDIVNHVSAKINADLENIISQIQPQEFKKHVDSKSISWAKGIFSKTYKFHTLDIKALQNGTTVSSVIIKVQPPKEYSLKDVYKNIDRGDFDNALEILENEQKTPSIESNERHEASGAIRAFIALSQGLLDDVNVDEISSFGSINAKYIKAITVYHKSLLEAKKALLEKNLAKALEIYSSVASGTINKIDLGVGGMLFAENRQELIEAAQVVADKVAVASEKDNEYINKKIEFLNKQDFSKADMAVIKKIAEGAQNILDARNFESSGDIEKAVELYKSAIALYNFTNINKNHLAALNDANSAIALLSDKDIDAAVDSIKQVYSKIKSDNMRFLKDGLEGLLNVKSDVARANIKQALADCEAATEKLRHIKNIPEWVYAQQAHLSDAARFDELLETNLPAAKELLERIKSFDIFSGTKVISDYRKVIDELELAIEHLNNGNFPIAAGHATDALSKAKNSTKINNIKVGLEKLVAAQASEENDDVAAAINLYQSAMTKLKGVSEVSKAYKNIEERKSALDSIIEVDNYIKIGSLNRAEEELKKASAMSLDEHILKSRKELMRFIGQAQEALTKKDTDSAKDFLRIANEKRETPYVSKLLTVLKNIDDARLQIIAGEYGDAEQICYDVHDMQVNPYVVAIAKDEIGRISRLRKQAADQEKNKDTEKLKSEIGKEREGREKERAEKQRAEEELERARGETESARREAEELRKKVTAPFLQKPEQSHQETQETRPQNGSVISPMPQPAAPVLSMPQAPQELPGSPVGAPENAQPRPAGHGYDLVVGEGRSLEEKANNFGGESYEKIVQQGKQAVVDGKIDSAKAFFESAVSIKPEDRYSNAILSAIEALLLSEKSLLHWQGSIETQDEAKSLRRKAIFFAAQGQASMASNTKKRSVTFEEDAQKEAAEAQRLKEVSVDTLRDFPKDIAIDNTVRFLMVRIKHNLNWQQN